MAIPPVTSLVLAALLVSVLSDCTVTLSPSLLLLPESTVSAVTLPVVLSDDLEPEHENPEKSAGECTSSETFNKKNKLVLA
jgi:hypothetical protein